MRLLALAALTLSLAVPARAASSSTFELAVDPNLELLGVVQRLADPAPTLAEDGYVRDVDAAFRRFKAHPAVRLYAELQRVDKGRGALGIDLLYYTPAPELRLRDAASRPPYLTEGADGETLTRFLEALRDFSRQAGFPRFFREHRTLYGQVEDAARRGLDGVDPVARIEAYLGIGLASRCRYLLTLLYHNTVLCSFIEPYPDPGARQGPIQGRFEVYTITPYDLAAAPGEPHSDLERPMGRLWQEPLYVFIDPSFYFFLRANAPDPSAFLRLENVPNCPPQSVNCAKNLVVQALVDRLNRQAYGATMDAGTGERSRYLEALETRLQEFESNRGRYPTLWSFYPRLFAVFEELKPGGAPAAPLRLPGGPVRAATDFFGPAMRAPAR